MRLSDYQINTIKHLAEKHFGKNVKVYLFGSRSDDKKKGGDIDLYFETNEVFDIYEKKIDLLIELEKKLGQRKIDIIINNFSKNSIIYKIAKEKGIAL